MNYKVEGALKRSKKSFIIILILWVVLAIVLVMPVNYSIVNATVDGHFNLEKFFENFIEAFNNFGTTLANTFKSEYISSYFSLLFKFTIVYAILSVIGVIKSAPKNEYTDIEHGSSDWSKNGEQYRILSDKKGIILAQNNYLPVDKRGNVNVLVVGRIRFW
jgi:hypothetical protein